MKKSPAPPTDSPPPILICGSSLFSLAVESLLRQRTGYAVGRLRISSPPPAEEAPLPAAVIFERGPAPPRHLWTLLVAGVPLFELDPELEEVRVFQRSHRAIEEVSDLLALMEEMKRK